MPPAAAAKKESDKPDAPDTLADQARVNRAHHINSPQFQPAEQYRQVWIATIPAGHTIADLRRPEYWMHVANKLRHYAHVECYAEDGTFYAELLVVGKAINSAKMAVIRHVDLLAENSVIDMAAEMSAFQIRYAGPTNGFSVIRKADNRQIKSGLMSEQEARNWLVEFVSKPQPGYVQDRDTSEPIGESAQPVSPNSTASRLAAAAASRRGEAD